MNCGWDGIVMLRDPMAVNMLYEVIQSLLVMLRDPMAFGMMYEVIQSLLVMLRDPMAVNICDVTWAHGSQQVV